MKYVHVKLRLLSGSYRHLRRGDVVTINLPEGEERLRELLAVAKWERTDVPRQPSFFSEQVGEYEKSEEEMIETGSEKDLMRKRKADLILTAKVLGIEPDIDFAKLKKAEIVQLIIERKKQIPKEEIK